MNLDLSEKVFIVSGGTRGLGFATAAALVGEGAKVVVASRDAGHVGEAVERLGSAVAEGRALDIRADGAGKTLISAALQRFGRLDGALVNTGGPRLGTVSDVTPQDWSEAVASTLLGPVRLAADVIAFLKSEQGQGGAVAFVLSISARTPLSGIALSNVIRPGLALHVKDLADAYGAAPRSVRVNGLLPAAIDTERSRSGGLSSRGTALGRVGEAREFGNVAAFLLSDAASFVTGSLVTVDGGFSRVV